MSTGMKEELSETNVFLDICSVVEGIHKSPRDDSCIRFKGSLTGASDKKVRDICKQGSRDRVANLVQIRQLLSGLPALLRADEPDGDTALLNCLSRLARLLVCGSHRNEMALCAKYQWFYELRDPKTTGSILAQLNPHPSPPTTPDLRSAKSNSPESNIKFILYNATPRSANRAHMDLTATLNGKWNSYNRRKGYIYAFSLAGCEGMFKVGWTGKTPEERLKEHARCYKDHKIIRLTQEDGLGDDLIENPIRVEQIIFTIFEEERHKLAEPCEKCGSSHGEWLKVDRATLVNAINDWTAYVQKAYDKNGERDRKKKWPSVSWDTPSQNMAKMREPGTPSKKPIHRNSPKRLPTSPYMFESYYLNGGLSEDEDEDGPLESNLLQRFKDLDLGPLKSP